MRVQTDVTYCRSKNCKNECGRKLTEEEHKYVVDRGIPLWYGYFCESDTKPLQQIPITKEESNKS